MLLQLHEISYHTSQGEENMIPVSKGDYESIKSLATLFESFSLSKHSLRGKYREPVLGCYLCLQNILIKFSEINW